MTVIAVTAVATAAFAAIVIGLGAWPSQSAFADFGPTPDMLGVDPATATMLGPEVSIEDKFDGLGAESLPATAVATTLLAPAAKSSAPMGGSRRAARAAASVGGGWRNARVSWYGPGFYGRTMAGGGKLRPDSMVVAHRSLPFGTRIAFSYRGRTVTAVVRDRGPFVGGRVFDLGPGTAKALGFGGVGTVGYRVLGR